MLKSGVVSVSFRELSAEEVIRITRKAGLSAIEWGSDVHAPKNEPERLRDIAKMQKAAGIECSSYGTYFRLGSDSLLELSEYIGAARILGTDVLRLWCGKKNFEDMNGSERDFIIEESKMAAAIAEREGVTLCVECHTNTFTSSLGGALLLMREVNSPAFRMYWQPGALAERSANIEYATKISPYTVNLHVFHCDGGVARPLEEGISEWRDYLSCFRGERYLLLEFMPDKKPESLIREAASLFELIKYINK